MLAIILFATQLLTHTTQAGASLRPCAAPEYRQFDFWLGEWDVFNPAGQKIGTNAITSTNDGCVVFDGVYVKTSR